MLFSSIAMLPDRFSGWTGSTLLEALPQSICVLHLLGSLVTLASPDEHPVENQKEQDESDPDYKDPE